MLLCMYSKVLYLHFVLVICISKVLYFQLYYCNSNSACSKQVDAVSCPVKDYNLQVNFLQTFVSCVLCAPVFSAITVCT